VTCAAAGELVVVDVATRRVRARVRVDVPLAPDAAGRPFARLAPGSVLPVGLRVSGDGRSVYVAATMGDRVVQYDVATLEALRVIEVEGEPDGLGATGVRQPAPCHACGPGRPSSRESFSFRPVPRAKVLMALTFCGATARSLSRSTIEAAAPQVGPSACRDREGPGRNHGPAHPARTMPAGHRGVIPELRSPGAMSQQPGARDGSSRDFL